MLLGCRPKATADDTRFAALMVDLYVLQARAMEVGDVSPDHIQAVAEAHGSDTTAIRAHLAELARDPERLQALYADVLRQLNERSRFGVPLEALPADPVAP